MACRTSTVARASSSARWVGLTVARQTRARVESLTFGASSRVKTLRASLTVSSTRTFGQAMPSPAQAALRWPTSKAALWATRTVSGPGSRNSMKEGRTSPIRGAESAMAVVMPVRAVMKAGMGSPGSTRVANSPSVSPPRTLTAPISAIELGAGLPPVVSKSTTTKDASSRGTPRS